ncbi:MAG: S-methyl-5-thioribose-1-phosphate isomerase [Desulfovermiculus sp.]|nr:S-methyl-5-thioribose-1-phosphate isomerase [Desulfovermiculus sp.]
MKRHIRFSDSEQALLLLDQRHLPVHEKWFVCRNIQDVITALERMVIRGAPAIGVTAAYGCCLAAATLDASDSKWQKRLSEKLDRLSRARPTAVNLQYSVRRMRAAWKTDPDVKLDDLRWMWIRLAKDMHNADVSANKAMGRWGQELLQDGWTVMTHCNAGALATGGYGTALGVIRAAKSAGKTLQVVANETRPFLQGARLTAYELQQDEIPVRVACDNAAALLMTKSLIQAVVVGADRIAANGDTANKIGTYNLAILAKENSIPFYVAAPLSTLDIETRQGKDIPIEERPALEVTHVQGNRIVPEGVSVFNYAFDITPGELITNIITEKGVLDAPFDQSIARVMQQ